MGARMTQGRRILTGRGSADGGRRRPRRATILIFTLGVLTLLALIGVGLLATVRGERERMELTQAAVMQLSVTDRIVQGIRERLRADLWSSDATPLYLSDDSGSAPTDARERNEPFDAPGAFDRWLASTLPYRDEGGTPGAQDDDYLRWDHVSYVGSDLFAKVPPGNVQPLYASPRRTTGYVDAQLRDVAVLTSHFEGLAGDPTPIGLPVGTTVAQGRSVWNEPGLYVGSSDAGTALIAAQLVAWKPANPAARFPYFDANLDGEVDLYDADGDGIPDSPLSIAMPNPNREPNEPRYLYAAVRIIDHASMLNVNTASSFWKPGAAGAQLTFDETTSDMQRRGRRAGEVLLDAVCMPGDYDTPEYRVGGLMDYRSGPDPVTFDRNIVRRLLVSGKYGGPPFYNLFSTADEMSLRHRFCLVPPILRNFDRADDPLNYGTIDRALRWSLLWSPEMNNALTEYNGSPRWARFSTKPPPQLDERADVQPDGPRGWLSLLDQDTLRSPWAVRRPMLTTISLSCDRVPQSSNPPGAPANLSYAGQAVVVAPPSSGVTGPGEKVDLNQEVNEADPAARAEYLGRLMWAFRYAGTATDGLQILRDPNDPSSAFPRLQLEAQLAANVMDFRDSDDVPTVIEGGGLASPIAGIEAQPFIIEAYAYLHRTDTNDTSGSRYAVELLNPYPRVMSGFKLRVGSAGTIIPLNDIPPAVAGVPGRLTVTSHAWGAMGFNPVPTPPAPANLQESVGTALAFANASLSPQRIYLLRSDTIVAGAPVDWPCDAFVTNAQPYFDDSAGGWETPPRPNPGLPPNTRYNIFQRGELTDLADATSLSWYFTICRSVLKHSSGSHTLGRPNNEMYGPFAPGDFDPVVWSIRNAGTGGPIVPRSFESGAELSRVLAIGNSRTINTLSITTVSERLAWMQNQSNAAPRGTGANAARRRVAGRLDFLDLLTDPAKPRTARIFRTLTCSAARADGIDNDGDGTTDEAEEMLNIGFRQAGLINVFTAPAAVLRGVPFMTMDSGAAQWDLAAAIVSYREKRRETSLFPGAAADLSGVSGSGSPFETAGGLARVLSGDARFTVDRFITSVLSDHAVDGTSPDFDRLSDQHANVQGDIRARDIFLARWANLLTTRSDVFTAYVAIIDENGRYHRRVQVTLDRSPCVTEDASSRRPVYPAIVTRRDSDYYDDMR